MSKVYQPSSFESKEIILRFLKEGAYKGKSQLERSMFRRLYSQYPDINFWRNWSLGFQLNSLVWFNGAEGKKKLEDGWRLFHLDLTPISSPNTEPAPDNLDESGLDNLIASRFNTHVDITPIEVPKPRQSLMDFLKD